MSRIAIDAWNLMGGIEWSAVPLVAELFGVDDVHAFARRLTALRDGLRDKEA